MGEVCFRPEKHAYYRLGAGICALLTNIPVFGNLLDMGIRGVGKHGPRHGHGNPDRPSPTYMTWKNMIARCRSFGAKQFKAYGGAGVSICDRWGDFNNFLADMGPRPEGKTLGRVLDRGDYEPGNVFWMTWPEQGIHRRNNNSLRRWEQANG